MFDNRDKIDFAAGRIPVLFRSIFFPTLAGMLAETVFIITDGIFVGNKVGPEGLASINLVAPTMMFITGLGVMFGMGGSVVAAIHLARGSQKAARINVTQAFWAAGILSALAVILFYCFPEKILDLLGVSQALHDSAMEYFLWFIPSCFFLMLQIVGAIIIRLDGDQIYSMLGTAIPSVLNIILDYIFIFPCNMGVRGAALATSIGTSVGAVMSVLYFFRRADKLSFYSLKLTWTSIRLSLRNVVYIIKVGFSGFIGEFAASVLILSGNLAFGKHLGDNGISAFSVMCYLYPLVINVYISIVSAAQPIISFNYGAGNSGRTRSAYFHSLKYCLVFSAAMSVIFGLCAPYIVSIFIHKGCPSFDLAAFGLPIFASGFIFSAFNYAGVGYFQSIEKSNVASLFTLLRGIALVILAFIFVPKFLGEVGLWLACPISEFLTASALLVCLLFHRKKVLRAEA